MEKIRWANCKIDKTTGSSGHHITDQTYGDKTYMDTTIMHRGFYLDKGRPDNSGQHLRGAEAYEIYFSF